MALKYSLNFDQEAELLESAIKLVLKDGLRTADIMEKGKQKVSTTQMGDAIIAKLEIKK